MNSDKVIIMEVKDDYAIVMTPEFEFVKVKKKRSMKEGQQIYVVDEDMYQSREKTSFFRKNKLAKILGLIAILLGILLAVFFLNPLRNNSYATVSLDGNSSIELELDKDENVIDATSRDSSIPSQKLNDLKGESFDDAVSHVAGSVRNDNYILASYYVSDEEDSNYKDDVKTVIQRYLTDVVFVEASEDDVKQSETENGTLGHYKIKYISSLTALEKYINGDTDYDKLDKFVVANHNFIEKSVKIREEIANKAKQSNDSKDKSDDEDDEEDDDDHDEDDDDHDDNDD